MPWPLEGRGTAWATWGLGPCALPSQCGPSSSTMGALAGGEETSEGVSLGQVKGAVVCMAGRHPRRPGFLAHLIQRGLASVPSVLPGEPPEAVAGSPLPLVNREAQQAGHLLAGRAQSCPGSREPQPQHPQPASFGGPRASTTMSMQVGPPGWATATRASLGMVSGP